MIEEMTQKKELNLLFIDDHELILQGYKLALQSCKEFKINFHSKTTIKEAYDYVCSKEYDEFDIIFFDIGMGKEIEAYEEEDHTGIELACKIRKYTNYPNFAFITGYSDSFLLERMIKKLNPNGIIIKDELSINDLNYAVNKIANGNSYFSETVLDFFTNRVSIKKEIDDIDVKILFYLSIGVLSKNLHTKFDNAISQSGIEKRKLKIKDIFGIEDYNDFAMVKEGKRRGLI